MHRMIHRKDKTLPVRLSSVDVKVKVPRRRKLLVKPWPVLYMTDWARLCFENSKYNGFFSWVGTPWIPVRMPKLCSKLSGVDTKTLILVLCQSIPLKLFRSTSMEMKEGGWAKDLCWWSAFSQLCHGLVDRKSRLPSTSTHTSGYLLPCWD